MSASCTNCGNRHFPLHEADEFPSVILCYPCIRDWFEWMYDEGVAHGNPLIAAFWFQPLTTPRRSDDGGWNYGVLRGFKIVPINSS